MRTMDDEGCIIWPRREPEERPWERVARTLREMEEERRRALREPLEIWGDIIIKGGQYQDFTIHGDMRIYEGFRAGGNLTVHGSLITGHAPETGITEKWFNQEPLLMMHGEFEATWPPKNCTWDLEIAEGGFTMNPDGKFTPAREPTAVERHAIDGNFSDNFWAPCPSCHDLILIVREEWERGSHVRTCPHCEAEVNISRRPSMFHSGGHDVVLETWEENPTPSP
jgi:hypothetical protein